jgi:hypothetical protein
LEKFLWEERVSESSTEAALPRERDSREKWLGTALDFQVL